MKCVLFLVALFLIVGTVVAVPNVASIKKACSASTDPLACNEFVETVYGSRMMRGNLTDSAQGPANCAPTKCKLAAATCGAVCACDFPVCECCPACILCLASLAVECCDCFLPPSKCPDNLIALNTTRFSSFA